MAVSGRETEPLLLVPEIRLAHSAISQLGSSSRSRPPSVYISGPPGTGKSHLARLFPVSYTHLTLPTIYSV